MDMAALPRAAELASASAQGPRWQPGLAPAMHSEIFGCARDGGAAGAVMALALDTLRQREGAVLEERSVLWVQDAGSVKKTGRPYRPGLPEAVRGRVVHVAAKTPEDALFALEEGVRCRDLACVIGEICGNPRALDFTASRRLSLAAEKHGVPLFLLRHDARADLSSARMRWQVRSHASAPPLWDRAAPGRAAWQAELFRARGYAPGEWVLREDGGRLAQEPFEAAPVLLSPLTERAGA